MLVACSKKAVENIADVCIPSGYVQSGRPKCTVIDHKSDPGKVSLCESAQQLPRFLLCL
jgi:hypothetical protein